MASNFALNSGYRSMIKHLIVSVPKYKDILSKKNVKYHTIFENYPGMNHLINYISFY